MNKNIFVIGGLVLVIGIGGVFVWKAKIANHSAASSATAMNSAGVDEASSTIFENQVEVTQLPLNPADIAVSKPAPQDYVKYTNTKYGFSFYHTPQGIVKEYDDGAGAMTVTLENYQKLKGMQVFIVPYAAKTISEERFKADIPSGVRLNVASTSLSGVPAVTFNSVDASLGETREIWLLRNGYLYEITTFKGVADWFLPIIQSWKFF